MKFQVTILYFFAVFVAISCENSAEKHLAKNNGKVEITPTRNLSEEFKQYWYNGTAEITSYTLSQVRYGEVREGTAVNIFVTEDFLPNEQVKADKISDSNIPVLKLNSTKKFLTGIYPYSVMTSSFSPVNEKGHAVKVSHSIQEWCGHVYIQLNNKAKFEITSHSYFEGEADQNFNLEKTWLENELWNIIRIDPDELPTGNISVIPAMEYSRLGNKKLTAYEVEANLSENDSVFKYTLNYPSLDRSLTIDFRKEFPYEIEGWEEQFPGFRGNPDGLKTTAKKLRRIRSPYWTKNSNRDVILRDSLSLN